MSAATVSDAERARFLEEGVLVVRDAFGAGELEVLREAFEGLFARGARLDETADVDGARFVMAPTASGGRPAIQRVVWAGAAEPDLAAVGADPRLVDRACDLLGVDEVDQLINQAHIKRPHDGVCFPPHQDAWNRRHGTELWRDEVGDGSYVQCVLTVDDMREDNGPLTYVPGSHREGPILGEDREDRVAELCARTPLVPLVVPAGALIFFGPFLIHGSAPNVGETSRRILVDGYARPGVNRRRYPGAGLGVRRRRR